jgi:GNAT superfamily N-acetyltransferase
MELPIAPQTYQPSAEAFVRAAKRAGATVSRALAEETPLEGAVAFTNAARRNVAAANCAVELQTDGVGAEALLARIESHFQKAGTRCQLMHYAEQDWPQDLSRAVEARGYCPSMRRVFQLREHRRPKLVDRRVQIIPARAAYGQLRRLYLTMAQRDPQECDGVSPEEFASARVDELDETRLDRFLARLDGEPVGVADVLTLGQIGVLGGVYTLPERRSGGLGVTLVTHVVEYCLRAQFEHVVLELAENCRATAFYEALGFRPVATFKRYKLPRTGISPSCPCAS